jgi:hypothetical protein
MRSRTSLWVPMALSVGLLAGACTGGSGVPRTAEAPEQETAGQEESASAAEGRSPTVTDLNGIWLQIEDRSSIGLLVRFAPDGTFAIDDRGYLDTRPAALGTFGVDGDTITFMSEGSDLCTEGDSWAWQARLPEIGLLHVVHTREAADPCRVPVGTEWTLIRLSPGSVAASRAISVTAPAEGSPPTVSEQLVGIWFVEPTGNLLVRFSPDGAFAFDNKGHLAPDPAVLGKYSLKEDTIRFTISGGGACTSGDSWAWEASLAEDGLLRIVHTKEASGNCRVPIGTEWTLIRVSPSSDASAEITAVPTR